MRNRKPIQDNRLHADAMIALLIVAILVSATGCSDKTEPTQEELGSLAAQSTNRTVTVNNQKNSAVTVYLGSLNWACYSIATDFSFCSPTIGNPDICTFPLAANTPRTLNFAKSCQVSIAIAIDHLPWSDCPFTHAELTFQGAGNMDTYDVSLVNGFNVGMSIVPTSGKTAGPATSATGNQNNVGVFPMLCDLCSGSQNPPQPPAFPTCPPPDSTQCHGGTQFNPQPVCQLSQPTGPSYTVNILP